MEYKINLQYKDRLFCFLFGNEKYKKYALSLYNALNGVDYQDESELEIVTIRDFIYIRMHNDVAVMLSGNLELWEHQSTVNPNMPIRGLLYFAQLYEKYIATRRYSLYRNMRIMLPTPKYIVFYNGNAKRPALEKLRLSEAFCNEDKSGEFEWTATVVNLNHSDNKKLLGKCTILQEYTDLVVSIRELRKNMVESEAVDRAVVECIEQNGELAQILLEHRSEVVNMLLAEFDEEAFIRDIHAEGLAEGLEKGMEKGLEEGLEKGLEKGLRYLIATLQKFISSPQELYQTVILNEDYRNLTFEEVQKIAESTKTP